MQMLDVFIFAAIVLLILSLLSMHFFMKKLRNDGGFVVAAFLMLPAAVFSFVFFVKPYFGL